MAGRQNVGSLEDALTQHREALAKYMERWTQQQGVILAGYSRGDLGVSWECTHPKSGEDNEIDRSLLLESSDDDTEKSMEGGIAPGSFPSTARPVQHTSTHPPAHLMKKPSSLSTPTAKRTSPRSFRQISPRAAQQSAPAHGVLSPTCARFIESWMFTMLTGFVIFVNIVFMAFASNHVLEVVATGTNPDTNLLDFGEAIFTCVYVVEMLLKVAAYGKSFLTGREWRWNVFDMIIVIAGVLDSFSDFSGLAINISYLRVTRITRLLTSLRVARFYSFFKELRVIIESMRRCVRPMFWSCILLLIVEFVFSLFFVQGITDHFRFRPADEWNQGFMEHWRSTNMAMISLFQAVTGGIDWNDIAEPLWELGWLYYGAFIVYICFFIIVVVNVVTGIFVDSALKSSTQDDDHFFMEQLQKQQEKYVNEITDWCRQRVSEAHDGESDNDEVVELTAEQFQKMMECPQMLEQFRALNLDVSDTKRLFRLASEDGQKAVNVEEFVAACLKLKSAATALDMLTLLRKTDELEQRVAMASQSTQGRLLSLERSVSGSFPERQRGDEAMEQQPLQPDGSHRSKPGMDKLPVSMLHDLAQEGGCIPSMRPGLYFPELIERI